MCKIYFFFEISLNLSIFVRIDKIYTFNEDQNCGAWYAGFDGEKVWYLEVVVGTNLTMLKESSIDTNKKTKDYSTILLNATDPNLLFAFESAYYNGHVFNAVNNSNSGRPFIFVIDVLSHLHQYFFGIYGEDLMFVKNGYVLLWKTLQSSFYADIYQFKDNQFTVTGKNITIKGATGYCKNKFKNVKIFFTLFRSYWFPPLPI